MVNDDPNASRTSTYLRALKIPAIFLLAGVAFIGGYYSIYVRNSLEYLKGRDLRILSTLGAQIQGSIVDHEKVLASFVNYYHGTVFATSFDCIVKEESAGQTIQLFDYVSPDLSSGAGQKAAACPSDGPVKPDTTFAGPDPALRVRLSDDAGRSWTRANAGPSSPRQEVAFKIDLDRMLAPLFRHHADQDVFDAVVLVAPSGRVIYSQDSSAVRLTSLDALSRRQADGTWKEQPFAGAGHATQILDVLIAGKEYVLYLQPCCADLTDSTHTEKESGWIVAALADTGKMRRASLAVSFSVMAFLGGLILLAIFSWPFLKLLLMGAEQRLRLIDVLGLGICSLLGLALVGLFFLDWYSYSRLEDDLDRQLTALGRDVQSHVDDEIGHAYTQLAYLKSTVTADGDDRVSNYFVAASGAGPQTDAPYPFFESFALIGGNGQQRRKVAVAGFTTPLVSTNSREYFRHWLGHVPPPAPAALPASYAERTKDAYAHAFLESIRSATTGHREAVLSTQSAHTGVAVAALTIPMLSLNDVVLPPGFSFAVMQGDGRVLFHSDPTHGLGEQFFLETDSNRRLRSAVSARRAETLGIRYFGEDYRAHVAPLDGLNGSSWSIVTLFDRQLTRTVNIEWLVTTMLFTIIYAALYIAVCIAVLAFRPAYRAPWIWPDPAHRREYQHLIVVYAVFGIAFVVAVGGMRGRHLLAFAWTAPFIVWIATYLTLTRDPGLAAWRRWPFPAAALGLSVLLLILVFTAGIAGVAAALLMLVGVLMSVLRVGPPFPRGYVTAAIFLLVLTAVLPTVAFFQVAHAIQIDSYVKYGQLTLAKEVQRRLEISGTDAQAQGAPGILRDRWSRYDSFFYNTRVVDGSISPDGKETACGRDAAGPDEDQKDPRYDLPRVLEDLLPYYSEASVGMRELLHDRSSDTAWDWHRDGPRLVLHTPRHAGWNTACVTSELPAFSQAGVLSFDTGEKGLQLVASAALALFAALWVVQFAMRRVFLSDVVEPLWARQATAIPLHPGEHLYVIWRPADRRERALIEEGVYVIDLNEVTEPAQDWFAGQNDRLEQLPTALTVVIDHLEKQTGKAQFAEYKLALVRNALDVQHRTVVLVSAVGPSSLVARLAKGSATESALLERRWKNLLARFTVVDGVRFEGPATAPATVTAVTAAASAAPLAVVPPIVAAPPLASPADLTATAQDADPVVRSVWQEVSRLARDDHAQTILDLEQIYEEVGDRLDNYHRGIWEGCSADQKRVLQHLAQEALINEKNRRTVRLLLARGLIRKNPNLRFVSEAFRRFVLHRIPAGEAAAVDQRADSAWDAVRLPFLITLAAVSAFFFLTQRELYTTTIAVITAIAGGIPSLVRVAGLFERRPDKTTTA